MSLSLNRLMGPFRLRKIAILAFALLVGGAAANVAMTPHKRMADQRDYDLEKLVPATFGDWTEVKAHNLVMPDPATQRLVNKIYNTVLTRAYRNSKGDIVMLVIAYGGDQSDSLQLHRPEVCYAANGYAVTAKHYDDVSLAGQEIRMARVPTRDGYGYEPVSYWMRVGERQVTSNMDRQIAKFTDGIHGLIPDGVLVRVSSRSITSDSAHDFSIQDDFVAQMLSHLDPATQELLVGSGAPTKGSRNG